MHAKIVLRQITSPTMDFVGLAHASSYDLDPRADCQAITLGPSELKADPMPARDPVVSKNHGATVQILYHHVHVSIIKKIAYCQAAGHASFHDRRAGLIAGGAHRLSSAPVVGRDPGEHHRGPARPFAGARSSRRCPLDFCHSEPTLVGEGPAF